MPLALACPFAYRLGGAANFGGDRSDGRPLGCMLALKLELRPDLSIPKPWTISRRFAHHSILSKHGVSGKPGGFKLPRIKLNPLRRLIEPA
jgi:hypothetical protein